MDPILFLALGAVIGLAIGLVMATLLGERRRRAHEIAVQAELQAARQRAERAAGETQAVRAQLVAAEIVAGRTPGLEQALDAARADAEWNAAHVGALETEFAARRTGRRPRIATDADPLGANGSPGASASPNAVAARAADPSAASSVDAGSRAATARAAGRAAPLDHPQPPGPLASPGGVGGASRVSTEPRGSVGVSRAGPSVMLPPPGTAAAPVDPTPDPPWMAEAERLAATGASPALATAGSVPPPRRERGSVPAAPPVAVLGEVPTAPAEVRAPRSRGAVASDPRGASRPPVDPDPSFPEAPPPTAPRPRTRATAPAGAAQGPGRPPEPVTSTAVPNLGSDAAAAPRGADAAADAGRAAPAAPEPPPPPKTPKPHTHGWTPVRPGLSDPWRWLGRMSPAGVPYAQDDLEAIHGVGPYLAKRLREEGILTWRQISEWDEDDMALVSRRIGTFPDRIRREDWPASARALHEARYREALR